MTSDPLDTAALRAAYASHTHVHTSPTRANCPSPEVLEALAVATTDGNATVGPDSATLEHVLSCDHCRREFNLLRSVSAAGTSLELSDKTSAIPAVPRRMNTRWLIAASALIAVAIGGDMWRRARSADTDAVVRGADSDVVIVSPTATTNDELRNAAALRKFAWRSVAGASTYAVEILDPTGKVLVSRVTPDTSIVWGDAELAQIVAVDAFDWMVIARRGDGNERRSAILRVRVARK